MSDKETKYKVSPTTKGEDKPKKKHHKKTAYEHFTKDFKTQWLWFNFLMTLGSIGLAVGTFLITWYQDYDCGGIKAALWLVFIMHIINCFETVLNLGGLEKRFCSGMMLCGFFIFEITVLVYMQVIYFESMRLDCITITPLLYGWLMGQILVFYLVVVMTVCFFFRKFCQDPAFEKEDE